MKRTYVNDGLADGYNAIDDGHDASRDGVEEGFELWQGVSCVTLGEDEVR